MITQEQARELVTAMVCERPSWLPDDDQFVILDDQTIEKDWGWVFFYTSKKWYETRDIRYAIAGNAPVLVERATGALLLTGTAMATEKYIEAYERTGDPHG